MRKRNAQRRSKVHTNKAPSAISTSPIEVSVERLSLEGRGVAHHQGKTLFVSGALPDETVMAQITKSHRRYDEANCVEVLHTSKHRAEPICEHYGVCGGCDLQHLSHSQQIKEKEQVVLDQLSRLGKVSPESVESALRSKPDQYRRSARVGINQRQRDGSVIVGFRRRASNKLTPIKHCPVLEETLNSAIRMLNDILADEDQVRDITHAEVAMGDSQGALTLRIKKRPQGSLLESISLAANALNLCLYLDDGQNTTPYTADATLSYSLTEHAVDLEFRPGDFLQVNASVNQQMISRALEWLDLQASDRVLDLFSGIGNFTLPLARYAGEVVGVEGSDSMVERATQNALNNQLINCSFYRANLASDLRHHKWFNQGFNKILLDPPRAGAFEVIEQLGHYDADQILYVSCNPSALARDGAALVEMGYQFSRFCVMDMFPHTSHVESLALFEKSRT